MRQIVLACQKGGVGKSTLCLNLLVEALKRGIDAAIYDADPQGSCLLMGQQRKRLFGQALPVYSEEPRAAVVIVDTAPHANAELPAFLRTANLVLVPTRPAVLDLAAAATTIEVAKRARAPTAVVLILPVVRAPEILEARDWVRGHAVPCAGVVHHRIDIARSAGQGLGMCEAHSEHPGTREMARVAEFVLDGLT